jgi:hypothetical protein
VPIVNAPQRSFVEAGADSATVLPSTMRTAEGSDSSSTTMPRKASDVGLEEGIYEMHALGATDLVPGGSAGHGDGDDESMTQTVAL